MNDDSSIFTEILCLILCLTIGSNILTFKTSRSLKKDARQNTVKYEEEIDEYNQTIEEYAKYINSLDLNHLQIIMKVIDDQWEKYKYGQDEDLITGYYRLSFQEKGYGVCTSFADDFTAKMNAINSAYEAKNVCCYFSDSVEIEDVERVDIERIVLTENQDELDEDSSLLRILFPDKKYGNHLVSMIKIPDEDYYLIVDPTNLMIGLIKDGEIYIFNANNSDVISDIIEYVKKGNIMFAGKDRVKIIDTCYDCDDTLSEIAEMYSYEKQLEALEYVESLDRNNQSLTRTLKNNKYINNDYR